MRFVPRPGRDSIGKFITRSDHHRRAGTGGCALRIKPTFLQSERFLRAQIHGVIIRLKEAYRLTWKDFEKGSQQEGSWRGTATTSGILHVRSSFIRKEESIVYEIQDFWLLGAF